MEPTHRVVPAGDGEAPTTVSIPGFLVDARAKGKKTFAPKKVDMQFIENHRDKNLYLEFHRDFIKVDYAQQSEALLQNFQTLLILEIVLLMGCDFDWGTKRPAGAAGGDGGAADLLPSGHGNDDGDDCFPRGNPGGNNVSSGETKVLGEGRCRPSSCCGRRRLGGR